METSIPIAESPDTSNFEVGPPLRIEDGSPEDMRLPPSATGYTIALQQAMEWLARKDGVLFVGQGVGVGGTKLSRSFNRIYGDRRLEFPVAEDFQMGYCIGLSLCGFKPVAIYPRWNFLLLAANQLVNHLDRIPLYSDFRPKVIIRTCIGANRPLDPGPQHQDDFTEAFRLMCKTVEIVRLESADEVLPAYQKAYRADHSTILVEHGDL